MQILYIFGYYLTGTSGLYFAVFVVVLHKHACTDTRKTIFEEEIWSKESAIGIMLRCLKNCKAPWFRQFKEALRLTGKTTVLKNKNVSYRKQVARQNSW